mmetsp:Transcript_5097/g.12812  ORF Transcript_5097/g.12812 Transcript_5097/m.12812 type:complete len:1141 (+) Transcript_5097:142-3564(+)
MHILPRVSPFGVPSTLLASILLLHLAIASSASDAEGGWNSTAAADAIFKSSSSAANNPANTVGIVPDQKMLETTYASTRSSAGMMFDVKAKRPIVIYGLDANVVPSSMVRSADDSNSSSSSVRVRVYTKTGSYRNHEYDESSWTPWIDAAIESGGLDAPTSIPQRPEDAAVVEPLAVPSGEKRAFYVAFDDGPYLRYSDDVERMYYINADAFVYGHGAAKRRGWDGGILSPRTFNGAVHYYEGEEALDLPAGVELLPHGIVSDEPTPSPSDGPTSSPTVSVVPTVSMSPTGTPTVDPTGVPTPGPTDRPTQSPVPFEVFATEFEGGDTRPVLVYAGIMFDIRGRDDIEISSIGFNTYRTDDVAMSLYTRDGGYGGYEDDISSWTHVRNVTVTGQGMGVPTYLPQKSFEPFLLRKGQRLGIYLTTDGPYLRASRGDVEGKPHAADPHMVLYQGVGKRIPMNTGTISPRIFNGVFHYVTVDIPTPSPTIDTDDLWVANTTLVPVADTYIEEGSDGMNGNRAQLMVDGSPRRVSLIKFDTSILNMGDAINEPRQVLSAVLRLYSLTSSDFGGYVHVIPDGDDDDLDEGTTTWENSRYGEFKKRGKRDDQTPIGQFRSIWKNRYYEMDITEAFRGAENGIMPPPTSSIVVRLSSDDPNGIIYRSRDGNSDNGPRLTVTFAYDPSDTPLLAQEFGSDPPTSSPTIKPEWDDAVVPPNPGRTYFNYDVNDRTFGPSRWNRIAPDGYYDRLRRLKTDTRRNRCVDGRRQSPRDLCRTSDKCLEFHETRLTVGQYGLGTRDESRARPTPQIMHNKLRLIYKERRSEFEEPMPPTADFARNGLNSGSQDLVNIDFKVRSEHRLCGKQYDGEMQLFYLHKYGNMEATSVLFEADADVPNDHFQILLDFFQLKFDGDEMQCGRRRRRARALFERNRSGSGGRRMEEEEDERAKLRGSTPISPSSTTSNMDIVMDGQDQEMGGTPGGDNGASSSLVSGLYHKMQDGLLGLVRRRREATDVRWDPLKPWDMYKSVHFWSYAGSTTEPPCFEDVKWRITDVPFRISPNQYIQLKRLMFDHVDPDTCRKTSSHYDESNARPVQPYKGGATYRCRRSDYASDVERAASGRVKGFVLEDKWWGVDNWPWVEGEFPNV